FLFFFLQAEDGIRCRNVTGVQTCALPISNVQRFLENVKGLYIDGEYVQAISGKTFDVFDPSTDDVIAKVSEAQADDVDKAVQARSEERRVGKESRSRWSHW